MMVAEDCRHTCGSTLGRATLVAMIQDIAQKVQTVLGSQGDALLSTPAGRLDEVQAFLSGS